MLTEPGRSSLVADTSAAVAVMLAESGDEELATHLEDALVRLMPVAIRVELGMVIEARAMHGQRLSRRRVAL